MNLSVLRPTRRQILDLAERETDPALYSQFEPIERGPLWNLCVLALVVAAAVVLVPIHILTTWSQER